VSNSKVGFAELQEVSGKIESIVFSNKQVGFHIMRVKGSNGNTVVKGTFPGTNLSVGLQVKFSGGEFEEHPTYGKQFHAKTCEVIPEKGRNGIITYLSSNVPSIGPITAAKLYGAFGDNLIDMLDNHPEEIKTLDFLTSIQVKTILEEWNKANETRTAAIFLTDLGLNAAQIRSVYTEFGGSTVQIIKENPYRLYECTGVGFQTADSVARKLGVDANDPRRVYSLVLFIMEELSKQDGHMFYTSSQILEYSEKVFKRNNLEPFIHGDYISQSDFYIALDHLKSTDQVHVHNDKIYLSYNWEHESQAAECVAAILNQGPRALGDLEDILHKFEDKSELLLSEEQRKAFFSLDKERMCVVSGYPGTGKTLLISAFVHLFEENNLEYVLLSPTGIAAKRLSQMTTRPASTIHRALGCGYDGVWEFDHSNKYHVDAVIVDEASMLDGKTFYHLISALPSNTVVVMVGDPAQLPSVGSGCVLRSLMSNVNIPHVSLVQIYRQEGESDIVKVAHAMLNGTPIDTSFNKDSNVVFLNFKNDDIVNEISKITSKMRDGKSGFQVLAPMYDGDVGINKLNNELRGVLNSDYALGNAAKIKHGVCDLYEGDRIMVTKNDYDRVIYNGDVGKIEKISTKKDAVEVRIFDWFDSEAKPPRYLDKVFTFNIEEARSMLRVAFACSCHRYQGNEIDFVILPMTMQYGPMLYRNLVYTALTRAKKKVFVFGDPKAFLYAANNVRESVRNSFLSELIDDYKKEGQVKHVMNS
jgi:exodeoxyribonuclease V alpha subunit